MTEPDRTNCPVARALGLLGDRWTLLIVRDLLLDGPRRFSDLARTVSGSSPAIRTRRLGRRSPDWSPGASCAICGTVRRCGPASASG